MSRYKYLLFDLDDTLWNFRENSKAALQNIFDEYDLKRYYASFGDYFDRYEEHNRMLWRLYGNQQITKTFLNIERFLAPLRPFGILDTALAGEMGTAYLDRCAEKTLKMPHAIETLEHLKSQYDLSIISNGFSEVQFKKMNRSGLSSFFSHVFLSETIGHHKPDPAFFSKVLQTLRAAKSECLVIGDNYTVDIEGAMNSGLDQAYYVPEDQALNDSELPIKPTYIIRDLAELITLLA
ncbi:YjjG family noncanonical pyrimidine nucleotidase [Microbacter margulisiae]|uniref:Putative hydrolase of the HAD superfamily n=1 Tax=Microbacter margulisiae TaxID=1350067 RepID=A0A7W5H2I4_9PORP|nr:YjjG family noncanonical pyrimidine nucleotidase [Microbacter margulisiae]MBB3187775.1 putative hydrolase of the HAD superfamily [Microbacter margulisiae]